MVLPADEIEPLAPAEATTEYVLILAVTETLWSAVTFANVTFAFAIAVVKALPERAEPSTVTEAISYPRELEKEISLSVPLMTDVLARMDELDPAEVVIW